MKAKEFAKMIGKSPTKTPKRPEKHSASEERENPVEMSLVDFVFHIFDKLRETKAVVNNAAINPMTVMASTEVFFSHKLSIYFSFLP